MLENQNELAWASDRRSTDQDQAENQHPAPSLARESFGSSSAFCRGLSALTALAGLIVGTQERTNGTESPEKPQPNPYARFIPDTPEMRAKFKELTTYDFLSDLGSKERVHVPLVQSQMIENALKLYHAEVQGKVDIYLGEFAEDGENTANDLSSGPALLVVKRYQEKLPDGKTFVVFVNERWPLNTERTVSSDEKQKGHLFLPDEVRLHAIAFDGPRGVPGSERLHVFDRWRILWDQQTQPHLFRHQVYGKHDAEMAKKWRQAADGLLDVEEGKLLKDPNERLQTRVPLTTTSCFGCHRSGSQARLAFFDELRDPSVTGPENREARDKLIKKILAENNNESIVPEREFKKAIIDHRGSQEYLAYLEKKGYTEEFVVHVRETLQDPTKVRQAMRLPGMVEVLDRMHKGGFSPIIPLLGQDGLREHYRGSTVEVPRASYKNREGTEFIESYAPEHDTGILLGQGAWWDVPLTFPPQKR